MMSQLLVVLAWAQTEQDAITYIDVGNAGPQHNIVWVILSTFLLIAIALVITLGLGAGMGVLRIWIFQKFPGNKLNGPDNEAVTRLHLQDHTPTDSSAQEL
jgi:hypothetical protein